MGNRKNPKPHGKDAGRANIDLGGILGAFGVGTGVGLSPGEDVDPGQELGPHAGPVSGEGMPAAPVMSDRPGFWRNLLTKGQAGNQYDELSSRLQLSKYMQDQENYRQALANAAQMQNTRLQGDQNRQTAWEGVQSGQMKDMGIFADPSFRPQISAAFKSTVPDTALANAIKARELAQYGMKDAGMRNSILDTQAGSDAIVENELAKQHEPSIKNMLSEAQAKRLGILELQPGTAAVKTSQFDMPGTASMINQAGEKGGISIDPTTGQLTKTEHRDTELQRISPDGRLIKIKPNVPTFQPPSIPPPASLAPVQPAPPAQFTPTPVKPVAPVVPYRVPTPNGVMNQPMPEYVDPGVLELRKMLKAREQQQP